MKEKMFGMEILDATNGRTTDRIDNIYVFGHEEMDGNSLNYSCTGNCKH